MDDLNRCILANDLDDLRFSGCLLTWNNKQSDGDFISTKIDRVLINEQWTKIFPDSNALFKTSGVSDHSPAIVFVSIDNDKSVKPFKFFNFFADHPAFGSNVARAWSAPVEGSPLFQICSKLKRVKAELRLLNQASHSNLPSRLPLAR